MNCEQIKERKDLVLNNLYTYIKDFGIKTDENTSLIDLIFILNSMVEKDKEEKEIVFKAIISYLLEEVNLIQNHKVKWKFCNYKFLKNRPLVQFDQHGRWDRLETNMYDDDYLNILLFVIDVFTNEFKNQERKALILGGKG